MDGFRAFILSQFYQTNLKDEPYYERDFGFEAVKLSLHQQIAAMLNDGLDPEVKFVSFK